MGINGTLKFGKVTNNVSIKQLKILKINFELK